MEFRTSSSTFVQIKYLEKSHSNRRSVNTRVIRTLKSAPRIVYNNYEHLTRATDPIPYRAIEKHRNCRCFFSSLQISIPMAQLGSKSKFSLTFFSIADILMAVHFTLDPYIYVLLRFRRNRNRNNSNSVLQNANSIKSVPSTNNTVTKPMFT